MSADFDMQFDHVHVYCTDVVATERWLVDVVGASVVQRRGSVQIPTIVVDLFGGTVLLRPRQPGEDLGEAGGSRFGVDHIGLVVAHVPTAVAALEQRGAVVSVPPRELRPGVFVAFIEGPDRIRLELLSRG